MRGFLDYLNPIARLGKKRYSFFFPLFITLGVTAAIEFVVYIVLQSPNSVGLAAIFIYIALILYFSFRDGIKGGFVTVVLTVSYYLYIIFSRNYTGNQLKSGLETTGVLALLYLLLAGIVGWLKQTIDTLIEREADEKRRLQAIVQQLPVGIIITDQTGKITHANKKVDELLGRRVPIGFVVGRKEVLVESKYKGKDVTPAQGPLAQVLSTRRAITGQEYVIDRNNKPAHLLVNASSIQNKQGRTIASAAIITDITQQKELEARKDDFVNMASHELKTPLTSMKLYIEMLLKRIQQFNDERSNRTLESIKMQTEKLQELVNDLLDVSRLQTGKLTFNKEIILIDEIVENTVEALQGTVEQHIVYEKTKPLHVFVDRFRIDQVLTNLITNAAKYSPRDKEIRIKVKKEGDKVIVSVKDSGIGIEKDQQKRVFDRLYQVTDEKEKTFPGLGMGLYISKEIVKRHKGTIWVDSQKGHGSTFFFSLPLKKNN